MEIFRKISVLVLDETRRSYWPEVENLVTLSLLRLEWCTLAWNKYLPIYLRVQTCLRGRTEVWPGTEVMVNARLVPQASRAPRLPYIASLVWAQVTLLFNRILAIFSANSSISVRQFICIAIWVLDSEYLWCGLESDYLLILRGIRVPGFAQVKMKVKKNIIIRVE